MKKKILIFIYIYFLLILSFNLYAEKIEILFYTKDNETHNIGYDVNTEIFTIEHGSYISKISNLDKLYKLKEISFNGAKFINDFSFLKNCKNIETILFTDMILNNLDFLYYLPKLKNIIMDNVDIDCNINLKKIKSLEYISLTNCNIENIDSYIKHGKCLKYVNLAFNKIKDISKISSKDKTVYILSKNLIGNIETTNSNIILEDNYINYLPNEYLHFVR